jgi:Reverse transcriptase (RNA-dependent DNA polymerase)
MTGLNFEVSLNGLDKEAVRTALLQHNYFPRQHDHKEELPPIFTSNQFTPEIAAQLVEIKPRWKGGYDLLPFRRTRHPNIPRMMGIPHPRAYAELVTAIAENWDEISQVCQSANSQLEFGLHDDGRIVVHRYDHISADGEIEDQDPLSDFGKNYRIKTDINNFYHSVYSHSLPWALVGHEEAKRHKGPQHKDKWFNRIDRAITLCQRCETKGMSIGPATSAILSEVILYRVDESLREKYQFTRYIDDYTAYVDSRDEADQFLIDLSRELERYALTLNLKKTFVSQMPVLNRDEWITDINLFLGVDDNASASEDGLRAKLKFRQLKLIIDKAVALSKEFPDGSVIKYAFSAIIEIGIQNEGLGSDDEAAERYFEDALLRYAYYYPTLIPLIQRWLPRVASADPRVEQKVEGRVAKLLDRSFALAQSDNIVWCIYYLLQLGGQPHQDLPDRCCRTNDPMVVLMGYVYAKKRQLSLASFSDWAQQLSEGLREGRLTEYDVDRSWLTLYQLYFDLVTASPPYLSIDDNKVFEVLKDQGVSFVDFDHADFGSRASNYASKVFAGFTSIEGVGE